MLILAAGGTALVNTKSVPLEELKNYTGTLEQVELKSIEPEMAKPNDARIDVLSFTIKGLDIKFAIHEQFKSYDNYWQNLHVGDTVKVYYSDTYSLTSEGFNLDVGQIEKNGVALIDVAERDGENKIAGYVFLVVSSIFLIVGIRFYVTKVRKSNQEK
jgi:hypothetical protein